MAQLNKKADGWEVLDENGRHLFDNEADAKAHMGSPAPAEPEDEPDAG
jgi:hypothetical protein